MGNVIDVFQSESYTSTEPISLNEAKKHLLVDFSDDDTYITTLITQCRAAIECYCNISITAKTVTATFQNPRAYAPPGISRWDLAFYGYSSCGTWFELPYGPVISVSSITDVSDNHTLTALTLNTDYFLRGTLFIQLKANSFSDTLVAVYNTGYSAYNTTLPLDLKLAILNEIAFRYEQRGNTVNRYAAQNVGISEGAQALAEGYRRIWL